MTLVLAVDFGASSIRVAAVDLDARPPSIEIVHRYAHGPVAAPDGSLRWDWQRLIAETVSGLERGLARGPVASIGIDTWGVDYGLIDAAGRLVSLPYSYRDARTASWMTVADRFGRERLYRTTGIQLMGINTIFQLAAHDRAERDAAARLVMLPELLLHALTGAVTGERTSAGTSGLVDLTTGTWSAALIDELGLDASLFPPLGAAGTRIGTWRGVPVHLVGGHDTASAVIALPGPPQPGAAFISSGTWMIVGAERPQADVSDAARLANFSNEPGALGGVRFLKNVMGMWMLEQCRAAWADPPLADLLAAAARATTGPLVDPSDHRFLAPADMEEEVRTAAKLPAAAGRDRVVRCIVDSLAAAAATVIGELGTFLGSSVSEIHIVGGGSRNSLLNRLIEERCEIPVRVGPAEATALGNALVQGIALGRFRNLEHARAALASSAGGPPP